MTAPESSPTGGTGGDRRQPRDPAPVTHFDSVLSIPEIRDYTRINAELLQRLDAGQTNIRLAGAGGHRLLLAGLSGTWSAHVEIEGEAGPELAAGLEAPGLSVVIRGPAGDGAARGLRAGRLVILGWAGEALGAGMAGGTVLAAAGAGHRTGLGQRGGVLVVCGPVGRLAGERQSGGRLFVAAGQVGPYAGHGRRGGALLSYAPEGEADTDFGLDRGDAAILRSVLDEARPWLAG